jgi:hypothetical protein
VSAGKNGCGTRRAPPPRRAVPRGVRWWVQLAAGRCLAAHALSYALPPWRYARAGKRSSVATPQVTLTIASSDNPLPQSSSHGTSEPDPPIGALYRRFTGGIPIDYLQVDNPDGRIGSVRWAHELSAAPPKCCGVSNALDRCSLNPSGSRYDRKGFRRHIDFQCCTASFRVRDRRME